MALARARLMEERKAWRKDHPFGFELGPIKKPDGSVDLFKWRAAIPGKAGTPWEGATYKLELHFREEFPAVPPIVYFTPVVFHVNVFPNGQICMSLLYEEKDWRPNISLKSLVLAIQDLLDKPNPASVACMDAYEVHSRSVAEYNARIRREAAEYARKHNSDAAAAGGGEGGGDG